MVNPTADLTVKLGEDPPLGLHNHVLYSCLQSPPLELAGDQFVGTHDGVCSLLHSEVHGGDKKGMCTRMCVHACVCAHVCACMCVHVFACVHVCACVRMCVCVCVCLNANDKDE